jgi:exonuclease III
MRILSWNMAGWSWGPGSKTERIQRGWYLIEAIAPDIVLLQETRSFAWVRERWNIIQHPKLKQYGSIIATKELAIDPVVIPESHPLNRFEHYTALGHLSIPERAGPILLASVHARAQPVPAKWLQGLDVNRIRRSTLNEVFHNDFAVYALADFAGEDFIIAGDWNTARLLGDKYATRGEFSGEAFFERAAQMGWIECMTRFHEDEVRTWFREGDDHYQLDHVFCGATLDEALSSCDVLPDAAARLALSDHAPVLVEFAI